MWQVLNSLRSGAMYESRTPLAVKGLVNTVRRRRLYIIASFAIIAFQLSVCLALLILWHTNDLASIYSRSGVLAQSPKLSLRFFKPSPYLLWPFLVSLCKPQLPSVTRPVVNVASITLV